MLKASSLRDQSTEEIQSQLVEIDRQLFTLKNEREREKRLEKPHRIGHLRRDKARLLTVLTQKQTQSQGA